MTQHPNNVPTPGVILPQDVAQQRTMQQQRAQQAHSMLINISTGVLCQLAHADELRADWSRQRPEAADAEGGG